LKQAVGINEEGINEDAGCPLIRKKMGMSRSGTERKLSLDDLMPSRVICEWRRSSNILDHHTEQLEK
jgi:hypothetical protein